MKLKKFILLLLLTLIAAPCLTLLFYKAFFILHIARINMTIEIGEQLGFSLGTGQLDFGKATPSTTSVSRFINITNRYPFKIKAVLSTHGELGEWVEVSQSMLRLLPGQSSKIAFVARIPKDTPSGKKEGFLKITFIRSLI